MTDVTMLTRHDERLLKWHCEVCETVNLKRLDLTPWYCDGCGHHDRYVELEAEELYEIEQRSEATR